MPLKFYSDDCPYDDTIQLQVMIESERFKYLNQRYFIVIDRTGTTQEHSVNIILAKCAQSGNVIRCIEIRSVAATGLEDHQ